MLLFIAALGCYQEEEDEPEDSGAREYTEVVDEHCTVTIEHEAGEPDPPRVGDRWTLLPRCDDALINGPIKVYYDPLDWAALIKETNRTYTEFRVEGAGTIFVNYSGDIGELQVDVLPALDSGG
jgi:hypothetical protein